MSDGGEKWVPVYRSTNERSCREHAFVLHAVGIVHDVRHEANEFILLVAATNADQARAELEAYAGENREWPTAGPAERRPVSGWGGVLVFVAALMLMAVLQQRRSFGVDWVEAGKTHARLIRHGEWWRTISALTLHADAAHLFANLVIGGIVGLFTGQSFGSGLAWFGILIAGASGNLLNAWIRPPEHTSVGASTAVFAALGLLTANAWRRRRMGTSWMQRWAPLVAGILLLGYLGTSGDRTDVAAHVFGFFCGALFGAALGNVGDRAFMPRAQFLFGIAALTILAAAWALALVSHAR